MIHVALGRVLLCAMLMVLLVAEDSRTTALTVRERAAAERIGEPISYTAATLQRVYRVTAYCDRGLTAAGVEAGVGQCAAPAEVPLGSRIHIPQLGRTLVVTDRPARRYRYNTVDIFIAGCDDCVSFGRKYLDCVITLPENVPQYGSTRYDATITLIRDGDALAGAIGE